MNTPDFPAIAAVLSERLEAHLRVCQAIYFLASEENQALSDEGEYSAYDFHQRRKTLLPQLQQSLESLIQDRPAWQQLAPSERARCPEIHTRLRLAQDLIMKAIIMDRENEQALLRRGLVPARHWPSPARTRPHYVTELYRRNLA